MRQKECGIWTPLFEDRLDKRKKWHSIHAYYCDDHTEEQARKWLEKKRKEFLKLPYHEGRGFSFH